MTQYITLFFTLYATLMFAEIRQANPNIHPLPNYPEPPTLAERVEAKARRKALAERRIALLELAGIQEAETDSETVSNQVKKIRQKAVIVQGMDYVITDTRSNITDTAGLSDAEIAGLYLQQMQKPVEPLLEAAPTNTIEYVIGAGMREDLKKE